MTGIHFLDCVLFVLLLANWLVVCVMGSRNAESSATGEFFQRLGMRILDPSTPVQHVSKEVNTV